MEYLEVIQLRAAGRTPRLPREVLSLIQGRPPGLVRIRIYRHVALETDWSLHLHWASERAQEEESALVSRLVQVLKEFGLVHQSVWMEHESSPPPRGARPGTGTSRISPKGKRR